MYNKIVDLHVHTDNSPDGNHSAMFICERAEMIGLRALTFCDHCEADVYREQRYDKRMRQAYVEATKAQSAFRGKVLVLRGIELGQPHYVPAASAEVLSKYEYDQVIGSVHNLRNGNDPYYMDGFEKEEAAAMFSEYLDELLLMLQWGNFDVLAHLTYPLRYFYAKSGIVLPLKAFRTKIDEILKLTAEKDKALEINTAGLRQPIQKTSPELETVKRFRALGGKFVTYGSDAHYAEHLAAGAETAYDMAKAAGFDCITFFQQRTPMQMPIE